MTARAQPGPEVNKLDYFVGTWTTEGFIVQGPWGAGGRFSWIESSEWFSGKFFVVGRWDFKMPPELGGDGQEIFVMGYDTNQKVYTFDAFDSLGRHHVSKGTVDGDTWIWTGEGFHDGQRINQKMTMKVLSPTSYSLKFELSSDATTWMTFMEGKAKKT